MHMTYQKVFRTSHVEGPVPCLFFPGPIQTYTKRLGLGKCSSHFTSCELFLLQGQRTSADTVEVSWVSGSPFVDAGFVSKSITIPSGKCFVNVSSVPCCVSL